MVRVLAALLLLACALAAWCAFPLPARFVAPEPLVPPTERRRTVTHVADAPPMGCMAGWIFRMSPDGSKVVTWDDDEQWVAVNGVRTTVEDEIDWLLNVTFSPDGAHMAFLAQRDDKYVVMHDGKAEGPYDGVDELSLTFSPDGRRLAYGAVRDGKPVFVVDGKAEAAPGRVETIRFDRTGARVAYIAANDDGRGACLVVDGKPGRRFGSVRLAAFAGSGDSFFTPVGSRAVEVGLADGVWQVTVEGQAPWTVKHGEPMLLRPDGTRDAAWLAALRGLSVDAPVVFSTDGAHWAVRARGRRGEISPMVDGKVVMRTPDAGAPVFSPDGKYCAYVATEGADVGGYVNGVRVATLAGAYPDVTGAGRAGGVAVQFSPDSRHVAFATSTHVYLDGRVAGFADEVTGLAFTPDSRHLLWCQRRGDTWRAVIDGQPGPAITRLLQGAQTGMLGYTDPGPIFSFPAPGRVQYLVGDGPEQGMLSVSLVEETLVP